MSVEIILFTGISTAVFALILMYRAGIDWFMRHKLFTDVSFGLVCFVLMAGTASGVFTAIVAGVLFSGLLNLIGSMRNASRSPEAVKAKESFFGTDPDVVIPELEYLLEPRS